MAKCCCPQVQTLQEQNDEISRLKSLVKVQADLLKKESKDLAERGDQCWPVERAGVMVTKDNSANEAEEQALEASAGTTGWKVLDRVDASYLGKWYTGCRITKILGEEYEVNYPRKGTCWKVQREEIRPITRVAYRGHEKQTQCANEALRTTDRKRPRVDTEDGGAFDQGRTKASACPPHIPPSVHYGSLVCQAVKQEEVERILVNFSQLRQ
jgi:hypothetical protein